MRGSDYLNNVVTWLPSYLSKEPGGHTSIATALQWFTDGAYQAHIDKIRSFESGTDGYKQAKKNAPAFSMSGKFSFLGKNKKANKKAADFLIDHSGVMCFDADVSDDPEETKRFLRSHPNVLAAGVSAGGVGSFALVPVYPIPKNETEHKQAFSQVLLHMGIKIVDEDQKGLARLRGVTYDPDLHINPNARPVNVTYRKPEQKKKKVYLNGNADAAEEARSWLQRINWRPRYEEWIKIIGGVLSKVGDVEAAEMLLTEWRPEEEEGEYAVKLANPLTEVTFGSVVHYARNKQFGGEDGSFSKSQRRSTDENSSSTHHQLKTKTGISFIPTPGEDDFFYYVEKGRGDDKYLELKINHNKLVTRMGTLGFLKAYIGGINTSTLIHAEGQVLEEVSAELIKDSIKADIKGHDKEQDIKGALIKGSNVYFGRPALEFLESIKPEFNRSTESEVYFYYKDGPVRVTAEKGIEKLSYTDLKKPIWKSQIIDREFTLESDTEKLWESDVMRFWRLAMRCEGDTPTKRLKALLSSVGYLLSDHKNPALAKAIVYVDEVISDVASGRSGKSLTVKSMGQMMPVKDIDSRNFKFDNTFAFQGVSPAHRAVHFNDCSQKFPFDRMYSMITETLEIEEKNKPRITLPFSESPKFILSTNYVIAGRGGSHQDRIFEIEFSDYFNKDYKPEQEFGRRFFDGWDADEWRLFDNVMLWCVQLFLKDGLTGYQHVNLLFKQIMQQTSPEFYEYVKLFEPKTGVSIYPKDARDKFLKEDTVIGWDGYPRLEDSVSSNQFKKWLCTYGELMGWSVSDGRNTNGRFIQFSEPVSHDKHDKQMTKK